MKSHRSLQHGLGHLHGQPLNCKQRAEALTSRSSSACRGYTSPEEEMWSLLEGTLPP